MARECCTCGHVVDEHTRSFMQPCEIKGCDCIAFEAEDDE